MQPAEAQKGVSTKSQLIDSLKVYLNKKNRLQPIIGLGSIIECVKVGTHNREALYLCEVCVCRLSKADMRNHIMGSLHRYNYIKAWHPHMVSEWKESSDLSKLAWPLMEKAKILEGKEGTGDVQLLEVEDAVYQRMGTCSEINAIALIKILSDGQGEPERHSEIAPVQLERSPVQLQRIVLLSQNQRTQYKKSTSINQPPSLIKSDVAPSVKSEGWLSNNKNNSSFLDGYTGTKPLIGLFHVVECRDEDDHTYCFLCHCCRIRSNKKEIIDHLTSSSHLVNYLMKTNPEHVEVMMADINDNHQLLQSLSKKVEQEEGRGELKVVNAPESLCILLTRKSYHWCVKMLCNEWTHTDIQRRKIAEKGPSVNKTSSRGLPEKCTRILSERPKMMTKKMKKRKVSNTVFKVSLPLTKGLVLLERTSFSSDSLPVSSSYPPTSNSDPIPSPQPQSKDCELDYELDCDTELFAVKHAEHNSEFTASELQQGLYSGDTDDVQFMEPERNFNGHYQIVNGYSSDSQYCSQSGYITGTKEPTSYWEMNDNRQHCSQERLSQRFYKEGQSEGSQTQNECLLPAAPQADDWSSCNSFYGYGEGCFEQWYNIADDQQQQSHDQYMTRDHAGPLADSWGHRGFSWQLAPWIDADRMKTHPHLGDSLAGSGNTAPAPQAQYPSPWQTYMEFNTDPVQSAQQTYMMQPAPHCVIQVGHGVMSNLGYNAGPVTNPDQNLPHPSALWSPHWS